jgi:hypothetical protein
VRQFAHERQLTVHAQSIPGGKSRRAIAYAASPEASEAFRRAHPPQPESAFYGSSSEDDECKYPDLEGESAPDDGDDKEAWLQRQEARRELLASEAVSACSAGEHVPVYQRLAEIENFVEKRLRETAEVSPWFASGVHWLCKLCGHLDPAMRGKNWVDNDDPGDERRVYGLGHEWCQGEARRIVEERRLAQDIAQSRPPAGETELEVYLRDNEGEAEFRATFPSYRGPWPIVNDSIDVRNAFMYGELREPYIDDTPRAPVPAVKLEPELDPIPDAIGQPPFVPRTGRPTAYWDMPPASKRGEPIDSQACKYGDLNYTKRRPKGVICRPCRLEHYDEHEVTHYENYCNNFTCMFGSLTPHSLDECVRCMEHPSCTTLPHCITDSRSYTRLYEINAERTAANSGPSGRGGGGGHGGGSGDGGEGSGRSRGSHQGHGDRQGNGRPGGGDPGGGDPDGDDPEDGDFSEVDDAGGDGREQRVGRADGWPRSNQKQRDRDAADFRKTAMGESGQSTRTEFQTKSGSGEVKLLAINYAKKLKLHYNANDPSVVRKQFIDLVANLHIDLNSFDKPVPITVDEYHDFEEDVMRVSNAIRDNDIVVTSRGPMTTLKLGANPCGPFRGQHVDGEALEALYPLHTPGVNTGRRPAAGRSAAPDSHFSLRLQRHAAPAKGAPHDPASARAALMEQGIKSDYDLVVKRSSKSRVSMQSFDIESYPFGCAQESPNRLGEREMVYELLVVVYPKHMFEGVAHGDVVTVMAKTASTVHNDDPLRKNHLRLELATLRLARGTPFEEGARVL